MMVMETERVIEIEKEREKEKNERKKEIEKMSLIAAERHAILHMSINKTATTFTKLY